MTTAIANCINQTIYEYNKKIAKIYNISSDELDQLWVNGAVKKNSSNHYTFQDLDAKLKPEVKDICRKEGIKITGLSKEALITAYLEKIKLSEEGSPRHISTAKFMEKPDPIHIRLNKHGNMEHTETGIVFDSDTKKAIGIQLTDGTVKQLSQDDFNICNKFNFDYDIPINLNEESYYKNNGETEEADEEEFEEEDIEIEEDDEFEEEEDEEDFEEEF